MEERIFNPLSVDLIGLSGPAGCGKDTAGQYLTGEFGIPLYALANPLKGAIHEIFRWDERHGWGELKEVQVDFTTYRGWKFKTVDILRSYLGPFLKDLNRYQVLELFFDKTLPNYADSLKENEIVEISTSPREVYQLFGTEFGRELDPLLWLKLAELELEKQGCLIITDIRFENEAKFIRDNGGRVVHIKREGSLKVNQHSSENGVASTNKDITILNNDTLEVFKNNVLDIGFVL